MADGPRTNRRTLMGILLTDKHRWLSPWNVFHWADPTRIPFPYSDFIQRNLTERKSASWEATNLLIPNSLFRLTEEESEQSR